jgi:hypothetical protein
MNELLTQTGEFDRLLMQVFGYSRKFAEIGIAEVLVIALREQVAPSSLPSACAALKAIAVNVSINYHYAHIPERIINILTIL